MILGQNLRNMRHEGKKTLLKFSIIIMIISNQRRTEQELWVVH